MVKKVFTEQMPKSYDAKSDVELIEDLSRNSTIPENVNVIKAILDKRHKKVIQDQTEVIQKANNTTRVQNWILFFLTIALATLTIIQIIPFVKWKSNIETNKLSAAISLIAAISILIASFFQWWDITMDGGMLIRKWVKILFIALLVFLLLSLFLLIFPK